MAQSLRAYARHRGVSLAAVQAAIRAGRLRASLTPDGKIADAELADAEWEATTYSDRRPLTGPTSGDPAPDLGEARARKEAALAEMAEMDLAERRGELVPARNVEAALLAAIMRCKTKLLGVPSRARQQDPGLTAAQVALFDDLIREAMEDLAAEDIATADMSEKKRGGK
jgi:phage terminase Nu1 subunit (DNA packaging protein)